MKIITGPILVNKTIGELRELSEAQKNEDQQVNTTEATRNEVKTWQTPSPGHIDINTDTVTSSTKNKIGMVIVARNSQGG